MIEYVPKGLVLGKKSGPRRRRILAASVLFLAGIALCPPMYTFFFGIYPLIFGLPLSLMWIVLWLFVVFVTFGLLYYLDSDGGDKVTEPESHKSG